MGCLIGETCIIVKDANAVPDWLQVTAAVATTLGAIGVLVAAGTFWWQLRKARNEREASAEQAKVDRQRHEEQIAALQRSEDDRLAAQARRIVPSTFRARTKDQSYWHVKIENLSTEVITELSVEISATDADGNAIPNGYVQADKELLGQSLVELIMPAFSQALDGANAKFQTFVQDLKNGAISAGEFPDQVEQMFSQIPDLSINDATAETLRQKADEQILSQLTESWPATLAPWRYAVMGIKLQDLSYQPRVKIRFEDSAGYTWERSDTGKPIRISERP
ncbi:hypothetical protein DDT46_13930 [Mycobacteroides abscessus]|uniref:hypothetical protein n=1 Tax=Mycobacteroides abscessus TaxID=36809 RepID=UPI000D52F749|nr:hypothetical protein [Mycobacteroides abscessus]AWG64785.1 hypothetical protein DDT46_13930 [Mycobacteroides abscessus]